MTRNSFYPGTAALLLAFALVTLPQQVFGNCLADTGEVDDINTAGVTVVCDTLAPNPFTTGIGSVSTDTGLTVTIEPGAGVASDTVGVTLADDGSMTNEGTVTATAQAVLGAAAASTGQITITNNGNLESTAGVAVDTGVAGSQITNTGRIDGVTGGVVMSGSQLDNSGTIAVTDALAKAIAAGADSTVVNSGEVTSGGVGVELGADSTLDNPGTIAGTSIGVAAAAGTSIDNSGTVGATDGAAVALSSGASLTSSGVLTSGSGPAITAAGAVNVDIGGQVTGDGGDAIVLTGDGNTLTLRSGANVQGDIVAVPAVAASDSLILEETGAFDDDVLGFSSLTMRGDSWRFGGIVEALSVNLESGSLIVNGTLDTSSAGPPDTISLTAGTLGGTGTIIASVNNDGGTVSAGDATGTLTVTGDYTQTSSGTLQVNSTSGGIGVLQVNGAANLAGELIVSAGADVIADILIADGGVNGFFDDVSVEGRSLVAVVPLPNSVRLVRASTTLEDNMVEANLDNTYLFLDSLAPPAEPGSASGLWMKGVGHYGERDDADGLPGGDYLIGGGVIGGDWQAGERLRLGAGLGYTSTDLDSDDGSDGDADTYNYGIYARYDAGWIWGGLTLAGSSGDYDQHRRVVVNGVSSKAPASYDSTSVAVRGTLGSRHDFLDTLRDSWVFEPMVSVDYVVADPDSYRETSGTGLEYSIDDIESLQLSGLLKVRRLAPAPGGLTPRFVAGVTHRMALDNREWLAASAAGGVNLELPGNDDDVTSGVIGAGFDWRFSSRALFSAQWISELGEDKDRHMLIAELRVGI